MRKQHELIMTEKRPPAIVWKLQAFLFGAVRMASFKLLINAIFANRHTNKWGVKGEEQATIIALDALVLFIEK